MVELVFSHRENPGPVKGSSMALTLKARKALIMETNAKMLTLKNIVKTAAEEGK